MNKDLTPRQWRLYNFLKDNSGFTTQEHLLVAYENVISNGSGDFESDDEQHEYFDKYSYGYYDEVFRKGYSKEYNSLSSGRALRKDIKALRNHPTIQKIIITNKVAETVDEVKTYLDKKLVKALKILKEYHVEKKKLENHLQTRIVLNKERDLIIAVKGIDENE